MPEPFVVAPRHVPPSPDAAVSPGGEGLRHPALAPLSEYLADPDVTDLFVNGADGLFVDRGRGAERQPGWRTTEHDVRELATALIAAGGRHIDHAHPCVDVRLPGGLRVHAVLPPVALGGTMISVRVARAATLDLDGLEQRGMMDAAQRGRLEALVADRANLLITGSAGCGKTTLLAALLDRVPHVERIVTIEDVAELRLRHPHHVRLEARQANLEGTGGIGLARLVREALRMRPDRLVIGECRGEEVRELLAALNTGHDGGAGTLHANGLIDVPARLEALGALAGLDDGALARQVASAIDAVVHIERRGGTRAVAGIGTPVVRDGRLAIEEHPCA
ncbi:MAG TPA: TadA family conjugal transfer-associated ATPase [Microbacterium sp.]|uniref:TadA family conjugal transfer-associated ATPase n=1 Tax=Microbacterium sp. TaxID=51671 RepID=UPI002B49DD86|nr:TadA family conjugal transfer-associated ATPase [Microbacterium sp.]HKT57482.1 TadA family conjugal transfer-associated ATPase [Microbacterium sp.]